MRPGAAVPDALRHWVRLRPYDRLPEDPSVVDERERDAPREPYEASGREVDAPPALDALAPGLDAPPVARLGRVAHPAASGVEVAEVEP